MGRGEVAIGRIGIAGLDGMMRVFGVCSVLLAVCGKAPEVKEWNRLAIGERLAYVSETDGNQGSKA